MTVKTLRLILTPIDVGDGCLIELDGHRLHLSAEVGKETRAVITLTNLGVHVQEETVSFQTPPHIGRT